MGLIENIKHLRTETGLSQEKFAASIGMTRANYAQLETGKQNPTVPTLQAIVRNYHKQYSYVTYSWLIDDEKPEVIVPEQSTNTNDKAGSRDVIVPLKYIPKDREISVPNPVPNHLNEPPIVYLESDKENYTPIPIIDISVAAGGGYLNPDYISSLAHIDMPNHLLKRGALYFWVKVKGDSMAPTIHDSSLVMIRLLDRGDWDALSKELVLTVITNEGIGYIKRVKNRLNKGFITLMSDNPDKANNPNFNLESTEIQSLWYAECFLSWRFVNVHDQYYNRLQRLEDRFDDMLKLLNK